MNGDDVSSVAEAELVPARAERSEPSVIRLGLSS